MTPRLALLSAILANPDDDLPRLVFADWLEEHGTSDADAARVELIRLGCKGKAKSRITAAETKWLDANWRRLLGRTVAVSPIGFRQPTAGRIGRCVRLSFKSEAQEPILRQTLTIEFVRGFGRQVAYDWGDTYDGFWRTVTMDEPLAYHCEMLPAKGIQSIGVGSVTSLLREEVWGGEVFSRMTGFDQVGRWEDVFPVPGAAGNRSRTKVFREPPTLPVDPAIYHPLAVQDAKVVANPRQRQWAAVATAMTAIAREYVGLDPTL